jgi:hypothetical protein
LYRIGADDKPFALLDSGLTEIRAVATAADGTTYAAAVTRGDDSAPAAADQPAVITSIATMTAASSTTSTTATTTSSPGRRSILYRIESSGAWEAVWESQDTIYDLAVGDDGRVAIATGPEGRLYRLEPGREVLLLTGVDAKQITRFAGPPKAHEPRRSQPRIQGRVMVGGVWRHARGLCVEREGHEEPGDVGPGPLGGLRRHSVHALRQHGKTG